MASLAAELDADLSLHNGAKTLEMTANQPPPNTQVTQYDGPSTQEFWEAQELEAESITQNATTTQVPLRAADDSTLRQCDAVSSGSPVKLLARPTSSGQSPGHGFAFSKAQKPTLDFKGTRREPKVVPVIGTCILQSATMPQSITSCGLGSPSEAILRDVHEPLQVHNQPLGQTENCKTSLKFQTERQDERINPTLVLSIQDNSTLRKPPKTEKLSSSNALLLAGSTLSSQSQTLLSEEINIISNAPKNVNVVTDPIQNHADIPSPCGPTSSVENIVAKLNPELVQERKRKRPLEEAVEDLDYVSTKTQEENIKRSEEHGARVLPSRPPHVNSLEQATGTSSTATKGLSTQALGENCTGSTLESAMGRIQSSVSGDEQGQIDHESVARLRPCPSRGHNTQNHDLRNGRLDRGTNMRLSKSKGNGKLQPSGGCARRTPQDMIPEAQDSSLNTMLHMIAWKVKEEQDRASEGLASERREMKHKLEHYRKTALAAQSELESMTRINTKLKEDLCKYETRNVKYQKRLSGLQTRMNEFGQLLNEEQEEKEKIKRMHEEVLLEGRSILDEREALQQFSKASTEKANFILERIRAVARMGDAQITELQTKCCILEEDLNENNILLELERSRCIELEKELDITTARLEQFEEALEGEHSAAIQESVDKICRTIESSSTLQALGNAANQSLGIMQALRQRNEADPAWRREMEQAMQNLTIEVSASLEKNSRSDVDLAASLIQNFNSELSTFEAKFGSIKQLENEINQRNTAIENFKTQLASRESIIERLERQVEQHTTEKVALHSKMIAMEQKISELHELQRRHSENEPNMRYLEDQRSGLERTLEETRSKLSEATQQLEALTNSESVLREEMTQLKESLRVAQSRVHDLEAEKQDTDQKVAQEISNQHAKLSADSKRMIAEIRAECANSIHKANKLNERRTHDALTAKTVEADAQRTKIYKLTEESQSKDAEIQALKESAMSLEQKIVEMEETQNASSILDEKINAMTRQIETISENLKSKIAEVNALNEEGRENGLEIERLQQQLKEAKSKLADTDRHAKRDELIQLQRERNVEEFEHLQEELAAAEKAKQESHQKVDQIRNAFERDLRKEKERAIQEREELCARLYEIEKSRDESDSTLKAVRQEAEDALKQQEERLKGEIFELQHQLKGLEASTNKTASRTSNAKDAATPMTDLPLDRASLQLIAAKETGNNCVRTIEHESPAKDAETPQVAHFSEVLINEERYIERYIEGESERSGSAAQEVNIVPETQLGVPIMPQPIVTFADINANLAPTGSADIDSMVEVPGSSLFETPRLSRRNKPQPQRVLQELPIDYETPVQREIQTVKVTREYSSSLSEALSLDENLWDLDRPKPRTPANTASRMVPTLQTKIASLQSKTSLPPRSSKENIEKPVLLGDVDTTLERKRGIFASYHVLPARSQGITSSPDFVQEKPASGQKLSTYRRQLAKEPAESDRNQRDASHSSVSNKRRTSTVDESDGLPPRKRSTRRSIVSSRDQPEIWSPSARHESKGSQKLARRSSSIAGNSKKSQTRGRGRIKNEDHYNQRFSQELGH